MSAKRTKVILFDVDGVLMRRPHYFSQELEKNGYKNVVKSLNRFFLGVDNHKCIKGKADIKKIITPYLKRFGWKKKTECYLKQQFNFEKKYIDDDLINLVVKLQEKGVKCYLCTNQDIDRAEFLLNKMKFKDIFDGYFISCYLGYIKRDNSFWKSVISKLKKDFPKIKSNEIIFFDNDKNNLEMASKVGIRVFLFKNINHLKKCIIS